MSKYMRKGRAIRRGDIYYAALARTAGSEQAGMRPILIVQNDVGNCHGPTVIATAVTSKTKGNHLPTHVRLPRNIQGLTQDSTAMLEQLQTVDKSRLGRYVGHVDPETLRHIDEALRISIGLQPTKREISC